MKIDENMIAQMTEEEQEELIKLIQKHRQQQKKIITGNFVDKLREMISEVMHNDITFYLNNDSGGDFDGIDIEVMNDGNIIVFNFNN